MRTVVVGAMLLAACSAEPRSKQQETASLQTSEVTTEIDQARDGPFGVAQGQPLSQLTETKETAPGIYTVGSVPMPYPGIETYVVQNTPEHGTCMIKAISNNISADSYGVNIRAAVDKVKDDLAERYGKPTSSFDFLHANSIWNEPNDWTMGLAKDERSYAFFWNAPKDASQRKWRNVESVSVTADSSGNDSWFVIQYDFVGTTKCDDDLKRRAAQSL